MPLNSIIQSIRLHYHPKSNCKKIKSRHQSKSETQRNPSSKKHSQSTPNPIPITTTQPILSSNFVEDHSNLSLTIPTLQLPTSSSLPHQSSSLSLNSNSPSSKLIPRISNVSKTAPSTPQIAIPSPITLHPHQPELDSSNSHLTNSPSISHFSNLSIPIQSHHHDNSSSELSSPTSPTATSLPSHDSTHSFKDSKTTKPQNHSKEDQLGKDLDEFNPKIRPQALKSNSFWKRISRNSGLIQTKKKSSIESNHPLNINSNKEDQLEFTTEIDQEDLPSTKSTSNSNEMNSITENSIPQIKNSNLTRVGTQNRNSFQKFSNTSSDLINHQRNSRTLSNYSPINSSPLSTTQTNSNQDEFQQRRPNLNNIDKRSSYSSNRLSVIPDGRLTSSDDLMKLLRGPSAYPIEAQPQFFSNSAPNSRPVSRQSRLINEI